MNLFKKIDEFLHNLHIPKWLIILLFVVFILRIPSLLEPYYYGDEMIYLNMGQGIRQGKILYKEVHDNKPPLLYLTAAISGNLFWFKSILAFWNLITIVLFWKLAGTLFKKNKKLVGLSTVIFSLATTLPLLEGNIANAELFMIGTTIAGFLILFSQKLNPKNLIIAGLMFSLSALFKVPAAFEFPAIVIFWLITSKNLKKDFSKIFKNTMFLSIGFLTPILVTIIWYFLRGAGKEYLSQAFLQNFGYLSAFRPGDVQKPFLVRNAPLLIRAGITFLLILTVAAFRKRLSKNFIFLSIWLFLTLFAVTLSERPYPHYLIQSMPAISLFFGILVTERSIEQSLVVIPLAIFFFVPSYYKFWRYPILPYYKNFLLFSTRKINKESYFKYFGKSTNNTYEISKVVNNVTGNRDPIFVWGEESPTVYALSKKLPPIKYVANYHIDDFSNKEEVMSKITQNPPKVIVLLKNSPSFGELYLFVRKSYVPIDSIGGSEIWYLTSDSTKSGLNI